MKHRQASHFQQTLDAQGVLRSMGITSVHKAAAAIEADPRNTRRIDIIRLAYGTTPEVRKALSSRKAS